MGALEKTNLEYTRVVNGFFLDYYGMPHWPTHLKPWTNSVSVAGKWAVIPGDGTSKGHFITSQDMARFVACMMDLPRWNKLTAIVGEELTFLQIAEVAERVRGERSHSFRGKRHSNELQGRSFVLLSKAWIILLMGGYLSPSSQKQTMVCPPSSGRRRSQESIILPD